MEANILRLKYGLVFCLSGLISFAHAQNVYKSIDENGNVSYTSTAPEQMDNVQTLAPSPEPSQAEIEAAKQHLAEIEQQSQQREQARAEQQLAETQAQSAQSTQIVERQTIPVPVVRRRYLLRSQSQPVTPPVHRPINRSR